MALAQIPYLLGAPRLGPVVFRGGFAWGVNFALPNAAASDGWIVQELDVFDETLLRGEKSVRSRREYAAWPVGRGQRMVTHQRGFQKASDFFESQDDELPKGVEDAGFNNILYGSFEKGVRGVRRMRATLGFYDDPLPPSFGWNKIDPSAGKILATRQAPPFWRPMGCQRTLTFTFDYRRARSPRHATIVAG